MAAISPEKAGSKNLCAFLDMIGVSELGEKLIALSDGGYNVIVGSYWKSDTNKNLDFFKSYTDHPRKSVKLNSLGISSTAAGKYQILGWIFDHYKVQLKLRDFSPLSQDLIALTLIRECKAVDAINQGRLQDALKLCKSRWASLPGAGYGQNEHSYQHLADAFTKAGGVISA